MCTLIATILTYIVFTHTCKKELVLNTRNRYKSYSVNIGKVAVLSGKWSYRHRLCWFHIYILFHIVYYLSQTRNAMRNTCTPTPALLHHEKDKIELRSHWTRKNWNAILIHSPNCVIEGQFNALFCLLISLPIRGYPYVRVAYLFLLSHF